MRSDVAAQILASNNSGVDPGALHGPRVPYVMPLTSLSGAWGSLISSPAQVKRKPEHLISMHLSIVIPCLTPRGLTLALISSLVSSSNPCSDLVGVLFSNELPKVP